MRSRELFYFWHWNLTEVADIHDHYCFNTEASFAQQFTSNTKNLVVNVICSGIIIDIDTDTRIQGLVVCGQDLTRYNQADRISVHR